eukprot:CAMPEP_0201488400 /NCGR_PEP_ID=MMETSP0151_2-20130828/17964_1 /ASSEMBLY_ACC=CAM_ASM_000257 /TAXON_ID=200890 /ORGANISM="Paramoeba atlantica, Strain 621/1 / CCAP 1560/9" /LENGTH=270 /DNA_ID=CAMNT_0047873675 /DNA_START=252 /DNA_END=1061 /DNA_ORIENTATION=-
MGCCKTKPETTHTPYRDEPDPQPLNEEQEQEEMWYYIDLLKVLQGPFGTSQMQLWLRQGYLPDELEVRLANETSFSQLRHRKHEIDPSLPREQPTTISGEGKGPPSGNLQQPLASASEQQQQPPPPPQQQQPSPPPSDGGAQQSPGKEGPGPSDSQYAPSVPEHSLYGTVPQDPEGKARAVVLYPYQAQRNDELSIKRADVVTILYEGRNWCEVMRKGQSGKVPGNYIEKIHPTEKVVALYDYTPDGLPSCLTFKKGEIIEVVEKQADGW